MNQTWPKGKPEQGRLGLHLSQNFSWRPKGKAKSNQAKHRVTLLKAEEMFCMSCYPLSYARTQNSSTTLVFRKKFWEVCHYVKGIVSLKLKIHQPVQHVFYFLFAILCELLHWTQSDYIQTTSIRDSGKYLITLYLQLELALYWGTSAILLSTFTNGRNSTQP